MNGLKGKAKVRHSEKFIIKTIVSSVEERFRNVYVDGFGDNAKYNKVSLGWYVHFMGSYEALYLGLEEPKLQKGDTVRITIESNPDES